MIFKKLFCNIEDQVASLELSRKLEELGVKHESFFYWMEGKAEYQRDKKAVYFVSSKDYQYLQDMYMQEAVADYSKSWDFICSAFTSAELGVILPKHFYDNDKRYAIQYGWDGKNWRIKLEEWLPDGARKEIELFTDIKEADARAKMLIHLIENNLLKLNDLT